MLGRRNKRRIIKEEKRMLPINLDNILFYKNNWLVNFFLVK